MNNLQLQQLSPLDTSYPQFQSTPTYDCQPQPDKTSPSQLPQYFTFEETWRQPAPSYSLPFLLPSNKQCNPGVDIFPELDQIQLLPPPPHYQYNSLSSEDDSSYQQSDTTPPPTASTTPCLQRKIVVISSLIPPLHPLPVQLLVFRGRQQLSAV